MPKHKMEDRVTNLERDMGELKIAMREIQESMEALLAQNELVRNQYRHHRRDQDDSEGSNSSNFNTGRSVQGRYARIDFPKFAGSDPTELVHRVEQFFKFQNTPEEDKTLLESFHLEGEANQWFQWYERIHPAMTWVTFVRALFVRFGPSDYEDFDEALSKLRQTGTIREYQMQFEKLENRVEGWPEKALVGCFIAGLKEDIRADIKLFRPATMLATVGLARMQEDRLQKLRCSPKPFVPRVPGSPPPNPTISPRGGPPVRRLNWAEMQARREKGLYYNCDDRFEPGHKCKTQQIFLLAADEEAEAILEEEIEAEKEEVPKISIHALSGLLSHQTMRVTGYIKRQKVSILLDSGSTHNFISGGLAQQLKLPIHRSPSFNVLVANGSNLECSGCCNDIKIDIQGRSFALSTYEKEMMAIIQAVTKWRPYLVGRQFQILTDHKSLKFFLDQRVATLEQQKWVSKLVGYDYEIVYRSGRENVVADALSRRQEDGQSFMISIPQFDIWVDIQKEATDSEEIQDMIQRKSVDPTVLPRNAAGTLGLSPFQKVTTAMRMLAYGVAVDAVNDYVRIDESTSIENLRRFVRAMVEVFGEKYLTSPNNDDISRLLAQDEARGFLGILGSIDCMHWKWKNCPVVWKGQYERRGHHYPSIILKAVASYDLYMACFLWIIGIPQ
ncbi:hypothetical protein HHK36_006734 [Tetracentron sinense]|uniref:Uncharacterized protein n=1 Tax=Tetracentron sinense TaxID=13715 RepID=A0A834ZHP0_TETSI|nr:hypothetical protein HHK36_006734 [Tetracentron sinense]